MYLMTNPVNQELFKNFVVASACSNNRIASKNISLEKKETKKEKINLPVLSATVVGTLASLLFIRRYQSKFLKNDLIKLSKSNDIMTNLNTIKKNVINFFNINAGLKEFFIFGAGSILGGITGGIISDKNKNTKNKIKEGIYQFVNIIIPPSLGVGLLKMSEKHIITNNKIGKTSSILVGIGAGIPIASFISNKINKTFIDKNSESINKSKRHMKLKDGIVHLDDLSLALILANPRLAGKLCINKILPLLFLTCGYEAGKQK